MELQTLLDKSISDLSVTNVDLERAIRPGGVLAVRTLYGTYVKGLILNGVLLASTIILYLFNPSIEYLIPMLLIGSAFAYLTIDTGIKLYQNPQPDLNQDIRTVLERSLEINKKILLNQCNHLSVLTTMSFVGGLFLGLANRGRTIDALLQKPIILLVLLILTIGFYFVTRTTSFKSLNKKINPQYYNSLSVIKEQLYMLTKEKGN